MTARGGQRVWHPDERVRLLQRARPRDRSPQRLPRGLITGPLSELTLTLPLDWREWDELRFAVRAHADPAGTVTVRAVPTAVLPGEGVLRVEAGEFVVRWAAQTRSVTTDSRRFDLRFVHAELR